MTGVKIFKIIILFSAVLIVTSVFVYMIFSPVAVVKKDNREINSEFKLATTTPNLPSLSEPVISIESKPKIKSPVILPPKTPIAEPTREVSSKSFEELINSSVIQLYCGYLDNEETSFSSISRGTGIIINSQGEILTNRHIVYDSNLKKIKSNCFVLKSPFPNIKSEKPKIYYAAQIISYPLEEKFNDSFSKDRYYNDFAVLKISSKISSDSKINLLLQTNSASEVDYLVLENSGVFNYLPIDWQYRPKNNDSLITLGYGIDASHNANQITSIIGQLSSNIDINGSLKPQVLLIEIGATAGFSGGALINPESKGLVGLISWITTDESETRYTAAIFRDFLRILMLQDLNFDLK